MPKKKKNFKIQNSKFKKSFSDLTLFLARLDSTRLDSVEIAWIAPAMKVHTCLSMRRKFKGEGEGEGLAGAG